jgi:hypothetical protein
MAVPLDGIEPALRRGERFGVRGLARFRPAVTTVMPAATVAASVLTYKRKKCPALSVF